VYGRTQVEVRAKLDELRERLAAGAPLKDATMTLAAWLDDWTTKALPASDRKQATVDLYANIARKHLVPILGSRALDRIRPSDVEALIVTKRAAGLAPSTVRTVYTVLRAALDVAVRDGLLRRNPVAVVKRPTVERRAPRRRLPHRGGGAAAPQCHPWGSARVPVPPHARDRVAPRRGPRPALGGRRPRRRTASRPLDPHPHVHGAPAR
jgi:hypothetical protein